MILIALFMSPPFRVGRHIVFPRASVRPSVCLSVTNRVRSITWKPLKLYSPNFIQISNSMRWRAECKNGNSAFYTFWVISHGTCLTAIKNHVVKYCTTVYERNGKNLFWSIKNSGEILNKLKSRGFLASGLSTYDLYPSQTLSVVGILFSRCPSVRVCVRL